MSRTTRMVGLFLLSGVMTAGCSGTYGNPDTGAAAPDPVAEMPSGIAETEIGLSPGMAEDIPIPEMTRVNTTEPGEEEPAGPAFAGAPPTIPHGVRDFLPITLERNDCMDCHAVEEKVIGEPTPIPPSHYTDLRNTPDTVGEGVVGARYNCVSCHISPGGNKPLVRNGFGD